MLFPKGEVVRQARVKQCREAWHPGIETTLIGEADTDPDKNLVRLHAEGASWPRDRSRLFQEGQPVEDNRHRRPACASQGSSEHSGPHSSLARRAGSMPSTTESNRDQPRFTHS